MGAEGRRRARLRALDGLGEGALLLLGRFGLRGALLFFGALFLLRLGLGAALALELALELAVADVVVA